MLLLRKALFPAVGTHLSTPLDATCTLLVSHKGQAYVTVSETPAQSSRNGCRYYSVRTASNYHVL